MNCPTCKQCGQECELAVESLRCFVEGGIQEITVITSDCCNADVEATAQEIVDAIISASGGDEPR